MNEKKQISRFFLSKRLGPFYRQMQQVCVCKMEAQYDDDDLTD